MAKLLSRSKHEESELNSVLQVRSRRKEKKKVDEKKLKVGLRKFSQPMKFPRLRNFATWEFSQVAKLSFTTVQVPALLNSCCPFDFLTFLFLF